MNVIIQGCNFQTLHAQIMAVYSLYNSWWGTGLNFSLKKLNRLGKKKKKKKKKIEDKACKVFWKGRDFPEASFLTLSESNIASAQVILSNPF